jgi:hypothetical protein
MRASARRCYHKHKAERAVKNRIYKLEIRAANPEKVRAQENARWPQRKSRLKENSAARMVRSMRTRIFIALRSESAMKYETAFKLVGCGLDQLLGHLEIQFQDGMTWENYGQWHVDHKRPCASFDLADPAQQRQCFNYKNLQPLWASENLSKGAKLCP